LKKTPGDVIYPACLVALILLSVMEIELYTGGSEIIKTAGRDAWLSVILAAPVSYFFLYITVRLAQRFSRCTILEYAPRLWGRPLTYAIITVFIGYELLWLVRTLWHSAEINMIFFLQKTPLLVVILFLIIGAVLLAGGGLVPLVRFFEFMFPFFFLSLFIALVLALSNMRISYLIPVLAHGIRPVLKGSLLYLSMLQGLEVVLFAIPFTQNPQKTLFPAMAGLSLIHILALLQISVVLGNLGYDGVLNLLYPSSDMLSTLQVPGWPVERFEPFLTLPWLLGVFTSMGLAVYLAGYGILQLVHLENPKPVYWTTGLLAIPAVYLIPNILWARSLSLPLRFLTLLVVYLLPLVSYGLAVTRKQKGDEHV